MPSPVYQWRKAFLLNMAVNCSEVLLEGCHRQQSSHYLGSTPRSKLSSCSGCSTSVRPLPSLTYDLGTQQQLLDTSHAWGHMQSSCSWHQTSAVSVLGQREVCSADCP